MPNFMAFVLTKSLVTDVLAKKGVENTEDGKSVANQLPLFAALLTRKGGISAAVFPAIIAQGVAASRADAILQEADGGNNLVLYPDARQFRDPEAAAAALRKRGFKVELKGNTNKFKSQTPPFKAGRFLRRGAKVVLEYEQGPP